MQKIETEADVRAWAMMMVSANGDKFTPLSKGEQFAIAKYIVGTSSMDGQRKLDAADEMSAVAESLPKAEDDIPPPPRNPVPCELSTATMTRAYAYHRAGFDVQQVFDKFLEWGKEHPKQMEVMDFSNGQKSVAAAFAFWLGEIITVDVPDTAR